MNPQHAGLWVTALAVAAGVRGRTVHELIKLLDRRFQETGVELSFAPRHVPTPTGGRPTRPAPPA